MTITLYYIAAIVGLMILFRIPFVGAVVIHTIDHIIHHYIHHHKYRITYLAEALSVISWTLIVLLVAALLLRLWLFALANALTLALLYGFFNRRH